MERCRDSETQSNERPCAYGGKRTTEGINLSIHGDCKREDGNSAVQRQAGAKEEAV